jgi:hypothetical protein
LVLPQWYDTRTMTIIKDVTFVNYKWQPQLGNDRMCVFYVSRAVWEGGLVKGAGPQALASPKTGSLQAALQLLLAAWQESAWPR